MKPPFRPQRARDTTEEELEKLIQQYITLYVMIKYDGVRCNVRDGVVMGKSMLPITNRYIQELYGHPKYNGLEFEIIVVDSDGKYNPVTCCAETVSFTNSEYAVRDHLCVLIDHSFNSELAFDMRFEDLERFARYHDNFILPEIEVVNEVSEILAFESKALAKDHEGIIVRNPFLKYKEGVSSKEGELLRLKRYISEEAIIVEVGVAYTNNNDVEINALGYAERSSMLAGKVAKEEVGKFFCKLVKDVYDPWSRRLLFKAGSFCIVAPGNMTKEEKIELYKIKDQLKGRMISFKSFPKGTKDKPRFATFQHFVPDFDQPLEQYL